MSETVSNHLPYSAPPDAPAELVVVCSNCSFPVVKEYDEGGNVIGFREEIAPVDEETALAEGWLDHGLGLFCPKCSMLELERLATERAVGAESSVTADFGMIVDSAVIKSLVPSVSEDTLKQFVEMFRCERLNKLRSLTGVGQILKLPAPQPKNDDQALEFLAVADALTKARERKES